MTQGDSRMSEVECISNLPINSSKLEQPCTVLKNSENIAVVAEIVEENPGLSFPLRSLELGIPQTSRILHKDLGLKAYEFQLTQELKPADHQQRRVFAVWVVEMHENYPKFH